MVEVALAGYSMTDKSTESIITELLLVNINLAPSAFSILPQSKVAPGSTII